MPICSVCKAGYEESSQPVCPNCGASRGFQQGVRRLQCPTEFVKSWWVLLVLGGSLLAVATHQIRAGLRACNWLDMQLARSGCVAKVTIPADDLGLASVEAVLSANYVRPMMFSPDGQMIAVPRQALLKNTDGRRATGTIIPLVSLESGDVLHTLEVDETGVQPLAPTLPEENESMSFSPDGKLLAASIAQGDSHVVYLWQVETGSRQWRIRVENCPTLTFAEEGAFVLCADRRIAIADGTVKAFEAGSPSLLPAPVNTTLIPGRWQSEAITPDQQLKAEISRDSIYLSRLHDGAEAPLANLVPDGALSGQLFFSPDGEQLIAVGRGEQVIHLWAQGSKTVEKLSFDVGMAYSLVWSPGAIASVWLLRIERGIRC